MMDRNLILEPHNQNSVRTPVSSRWETQLEMQMTCDWSVFLSPNTFSAILFPPEDKQTQDEKLSKTEKTSASYSSGFCKKDTRNRRGY